MAPTFEKVLAFPHLHGFRYDYVRDDYKVIQRVSYSSLKKICWDIDAPNYVKNLHPIGGINN
ncbi:hypothetical protein MTR_1g090180 [Medicago truncatula]|uniref:Uncharacterized protein n=1 Tax=Medicago truncatula TaxID=3880 RepID=G7I2Z2_MEDTR|nr:hypothetical protein MTR_1g090180 [Medicago truncatula]